MKNKLILVVTLLCIVIMLSSCEYKIEEILGEEVTHTLQEDTQTSQDETQSENKKETQPITEKETQEVEKEEATHQQEEIENKNTPESLGQEYIEHSRLANNYQGLVDLCYPQAVEKLMIQRGQDPVLFVVDGNLSLRHGKESIVMDSIVAYVDGTEKSSQTSIDSINDYYNELGVEVSETTDVKIYLEAKTTNGQETKGEYNILAVKINGNWYLHISVL